MSEVWEYISGYEGIYKFSNNGKLLDCRNDLITESNYYELKNDNTTTKVSKECLLYATFPELKPVVKYEMNIDGIGYFSLKEASTSLNLKEATIKRRLESSKFENYKSLI